MNKLLNFFKPRPSIKNVDGISSLLVIFERLKVLITYNILDYSLVKEIIMSIMITYSNNINNNSSSSEGNFTNFLILFLKEIRKFYRILQKRIKRGINLSLYYQILNLTLFWNVLIISMKNTNNFEPNAAISFYEIFFEKNNRFMNILKKIIIHTRKLESQTELLKLISNIFSEFGEIKQIMYTLFESKSKLEDLFYHNQRIFKKIIPEMEDFRQNAPDNLLNSIYIKFLEIIENLEFNYETMFNSKNSNMDIFCLHEDKPLIKSMLCQTILRIVFSKEKNKFLKEDAQFEINFIKNLTKKCVTYYYDKFGDNANCLFRREELYDDLIKYMFFTHGNNLFYKSYYLNLKKIIDKYSNEDLLTDVTYLSQEEFILFYDDLLLQLKLYIPSNLKIILKLLYQNVLEIYTKTDELDKFSPVLTILFFNFFISPRLQDIYNISPIKNMMVKNLNRLIRNICFNEKFKEEDSMNYFNEIIEICNLHTISTLEKILNSFIIDDMDYIIKSEMELDSKFITFPSYLFYFDCNYVLSVWEFSMNQNILQNINDEFNYIEKVMSSKNSSFYIKVNLEDFKKLKILENTNENDEESDEDLDDEGIGEPKCNESEMKEQKLVIEENNELNDS